VRRRRAPTAPGDAASTSGGEQPAARSPSHANTARASCIGSTTTCSPSASISTPAQPSHLIFIVDLLSINGIYSTSVLFHTKRELYSTSVR
jgi:hypothetical protein